MKKKITISRKTQKLLLGVCLAAMLTLGVGLLFYIKTVDSSTMGRRVSVYGVDVSRLTPEQASQKILTAFADRAVVFQEKGEEVYVTTLGVLGYSLEEENLKEQLETIREQRAKESGILAVKANYTPAIQVQKDQGQRNTALSTEHFAGRERTASVDASVSYDEEKQEFVVNSAVQGNQLNQEKLLSYVDEALDSALGEGILGSAIRLELSEQVYEQPDTAVTETVKSQVVSLNQRLQSYRTVTVTYTFGAETQVLDSETIASWIQIGEDSVSIDETAAEAYVAQLAADYNTIYVPRSFHTSSGTDITIEGNEYGYWIDQSGELTQLLADLEGGTALSREPVYSKTGFQRNGRDDLVGSYIEVSLDDQHLWLYKDGVLVTETDIVSGEPTEEKETYRGAWPIAYKASPFTLSSDYYGYETDVQYWMPFVYGQGLHDASWQSTFGGDRYKTGAGSHGCINLPTDQAALIYNTIDAGYPILIY